MDKYLAYLLLITASKKAKGVPAGTPPGYAPRKLHNTITIEIISFHVVFVNEAS